MSASRTHQRRGFSLLELMFATAIGGLLVGVAANLARWGARQSGRGDEANSLSQRARLLRNQLRADLEVAGFGSTGAITYPAGDAWWTPLGVGLTAGRHEAMPSVRGANNITGDPRVVPGSDAIQIVVPDPSSRQQTNAVSTGNLLQILTAMDQRVPASLSCPVVNGEILLYVTDHSAPNGAGRAHLMKVAPSAAPAPLMPPGATLRFDIAPGSDVMCARISTYWLDNQAPNQSWLHRTDLIPDSVLAPFAGTNIFVTAPAVRGADLVSPGVVDLQIAYGFSSEFPGGLVPRTAPEAARWAFDGVVGAVDTAPQILAFGADPGWFEARQVRVSMLLRTLRRVDESSFAIQPLPLEDRDPATAPAIEVNYGRMAMTTSTVLTNLRYFDFSGSAGLVAEPY